MVRGVLAGLLSGSAIATLVLAGVSLMLPPPMTDGPVAAPLAEVMPGRAPMPATAPAGVADETRPDPAPEVAAEAESEPRAAPGDPPDLPDSADLAVVPATPPAEVAPAPVEQADTMPVASVVEVPAGSEFARPPSDEAAILPAPEPVAPAGAAPDVAVPTAEAAPQIADVAPFDAPDAGAAPTAPPAPSAAPAGDLALAPSPVAPVTEAAPTLEHDSVAESPAQPSVSEAPAAPAPHTLKPEETAEIEPSADDAPGDASEGAADQTSTGDSSDGIVLAELAPLAPPVTGSNPDVSAQDNASTVAPETPAEEAPVADALASDAAPADPTATTDPAATTDAALPPMIQTDAPAAPIGVAEAPQPGFKGASGVKVNRLPTIGGNAAPELPAADAENAVLIDPASLPPISRFAAPFDNPSDLPLLSVLLIDLGEGAGGLDVDALRTLSIPLTIAVDPTNPDAGDRARAFREAGFEVAILTNLPQGATASDAEVAYQGAREALPEAIALVGAPEAPMQSNGQVAAHMVALAKADGLGIISYARGLNQIARLAGAAEVPHAEVWREADSGSARSEAIRRTLDRAAFEAAQSGSAVVALQTAPESVTALFAWSAEAAEGVVLAPVSAVALKSVATQPLEAAMPDATPELPASRLPQVNPAVPQQDSPGYSP